MVHTVWSKVVENFRLPAVCIFFGRLCKYIALICVFRIGTKRLEQVWRCVLMFPQQVPFFQIKFEMRKNAEIELQNEDKTIFIKRDRVAMVILEYREKFYSFFYHITLSIGFVQIWTIVFANLNDPLRFSESKLFIK